MVTGYAQNGEFEKALRLFSRMQLQGIWPNQFTFVGVLNACGDLTSLLEGKQIHAYLVKLGFELQVYIKSALVDMYAKCGNIEDARKGFDQLNKSCDADTVLWSTMIGGYVKNGHEEEALALFVMMQKEGILPNNLTIATVLRACSSLAALEQGKQIHAQALKYGFGLGIPLGSALSTMYAKSGNLDDCSLVFRRMAQRDVIAWNSVISGFSQNGYGVEALDLFEEMKLEGTEPDNVTFINLLFTCSHMGLVERGWSYFRSMYKDHDLVPKVEHYACMVDLLGRAGKLTEAREFIERIPIQPDSSVWGALLGACRMHPNVEIAELAARSLFELDSKNSGRYILLSNVYTSLGKIEEANRIRSLMRRKGVRKTAGYSVIEVKNKVYKFSVGDKMKPHTDMIYRELDILMARIREAGYVPNTNFALHDVEEEAKESSLYVHSEKLAIVFGLMNSGPESEIRIHKNLRVCGDCHTATKFISEVTGREIVVGSQSPIHQ
nr:pentatricopeptide repeat protein AaPPR1259 [Agave angustifolia]